MWRMDTFFSVYLRPFNIFIIKGHKWIELVCYWADTEIPEPMLTCRLQLGSQVTIWLKADGLQLASLFNLSDRIPGFHYWAAGSLFFQRPFVGRNLNKMGQTHKNLVAFPRSGALSTWKQFNFCLFTAYLYFLVHNLVRRAHTRERLFLRQKNEAHFCYHAGDVTGFSRHWALRGFLCHRTHKVTCAYQLQIPGLQCICTTSH